MDEVYIGGALPSQPDIRDYIARATAHVDFPKEFELPMPKVKFQGMTGSCVAHAIATVVEYFYHKETGTYVDMSTTYIYGNRRDTKHKGTGMATKDGIKNVVKYGTVPYDYLIGNSEVPYAIQQFENNVDSLEEIGHNFKFDEYFLLKDDDAIKTSLMENGPAILAMWWFNDIMIINGVMRTKCDKYTRGSHCMVIYGWDETGWKVQNSWGPLWGKNGRAIIPYNVWIKDVWGIKDAASTTTLHIARPFQNKWSAVLAKVLNMIVGIAYNITHLHKR